MSFPMIASRGVAWTTAHSGAAIRRTSSLTFRSRHGILSSRARRRSQYPSHIATDSSNNNSDRSLLLLAMTISGGAAASSSSMTHAESNENENISESGSTSAEKKKIDDATVTSIPFVDETLEYDHYKGVLLHLEKLRKHGDVELSKASFADELRDALSVWKAEGRKGIWVYAPNSMSDYIPLCIEQGFRFHFVKDGVLVLTKWLPEDSPNRLPLGPSHQVGVGTLVLHPNDPTLMLCVQELSGPAAARKLWKMPTGLLDPGEDIPDAAKRELLEETGLKASVDGIVCFRQAHSPSRSSDLFFVCKMSLDSDDIVFRAQPEEIAEIRWMKVEEYAAQDLWQQSPVYQSMNEAIRRAASSEQGATMSSEQLPIGWRDGTNAIFRNK